MKLFERQLKKFEKRGEEIITGKRNSFDRRWDRIEKKDNKFFDRQTTKEK